MNTGSLGTARAYHTATLLPNGTVLVAGGYNQTSSSLPSAELYDPASATWSATGSLGVRRTFHTATLLPGGKVLVAGGSNGLNALASAELYDPASGTWSVTGSPGLGRTFHTATLLPNGKVLVAGGSSGGVYQASAELYDPASETWSFTGNLATARSVHTATSLPSGKVLVAGGFNGPSSLASAELYDPVSGTWAVTGSLAADLQLHTATLLPNGKVLRAGGLNESSISATCELYDPESGTWSLTGAPGIEFVSHRATLLSNGNVLVAGGENGSGFLANAELYDPVSGIWTATGSLGTARSYHTATLLPNGNLLIAGGFDGGVLASAELYLGPAAPPTLLNLATRMRVLTGDNTLIGGFIVTGTELKRVLIRGIGPSLSGVGVALSDPTLELHQGSTTIATNDNWKVRSDATSQQGDIESTTIPPTNDSESAILAMLSPGAYTVILAGQDGGTGVGLVEVYDLGQGASSLLANISTRGFVDTGDNVMIGGLIVGGGSGSGTARVIVRALGPSVPVASFLSDPTLELHDGSGTTMAFNDNWKTRPDGSSQQAEIEATTVPPTNALEAALVLTLAPGNYTAVVRGINKTTGVGLVEAYHLP